MENIPVNDPEFLTACDRFLSTMLSRRYSNDAEIGAHNSVTSAEGNVSATTRDTDRKTLIDRALRLCHNTGLAKNAKRVFGANLIGKRLVPRLRLTPDPTTGPEAAAAKLLNPGFTLTDDISKQMNYLVPKLIERFSRRPTQCGRHTLSQFLRLCATVRWVRGEVFIHFLEVNDAKIAPFGFLLELVPAAQIKQPPDYKDDKKLTGQVGDRIVDGIELDNGRIVAYWVTKKKVGEDKEETVRVPAEDMIHWTRIEDEDGLHGWPELNGGMQCTDDISDLMNAYIITAILEARILAFRTTSGDNTNSPASVAPGGRPTRGPMGGEMIPDPKNQDKYVEKIPNGAVITGPRNSTYVPIEKKTPPATFSEFLRHTYLEFCQAVGMPYELISGDRSKSKYTSERAGNEEFRRLVETDQADLDDTVLDRIVERVILGAARAELLPMTEEECTARMHDLLNVEWSFPKRTNLDPAKEAAANKTNAEMKFASFPRIISDQGSDWEDTIAENERYEIARIKSEERIKKAAEAAGVDWSPAKPTEDPVPPEPTDGENDNPDDEEADDADAEE